MNDRTELYNVLQKIGLGSKLQEVLNQPGTKFSGDKLFSLSLRNLEIKKLPPGVFDSLLNLKSLDLSYNILRSLPDNIFANQQNLVSLSLLHNQLKSLPVSVGNLTNLSRILFQGNLLPGNLNQNIGGKYTVQKILQPFKERWSHQRTHTFPSMNKTKIGRKDKFFTKANQAQPNPDLTAMVQKGLKLFTDVILEEGQKQFQLDTEITNQEKELEKVQRERKERIVKFEKVIQRSEEIKISDLATYLNMNKFDLLNWLFDLPDKYGFTLKKDVLSFDQSSVTEHIDELLSEFEKLEKGKIGKIGAGSGLVKSFRRGD